MENFALLFHGFQVVFTLQNIGACLLGAFLGLVVGAMPGIGSLAGVALLLPLTYKFNPTTAIVLLGALYYSNMYGGAFSAILLNIQIRNACCREPLQVHRLCGLPYVR